jgi:hypothetical protein
VDHGARNRISFGIHHPPGDDALRRQAYIDSCFTLARCNQKGLIRLHESIAVDHEFVSSAGGYPEGEAARFIGGCVIGRTGWIGLVAKGESRLLNWLARHAIHHPAGNV